MPRVLLVFEPPDGGVAENVVQLATELGDHGWAVTIAGPQDATVYGRVDPALPAHRLPLVRGYGSPGSDLAALRGLVRVIRAGRFDVVHCHSAKAGVLGRLAAAVCRVPVVYSPHCFPFIGDFGAGRRAFATAVERLLAPLTTRTICVCEDERRQALRARAGREEQLRVVLNGSDPCPPDVERDQALVDLRGDGVVAAAVTVLRAQKTVEVFVDAAPEILRRSPRARLAVVGDGPEREALHARARGLWLDEDARFAFLPFEAPAARHLKALDAYVLSSAWEALPIGVLEALSCGVPQVATDVGGTGEAVAPETGLLVPPHDPAALADAVVDLLGDEERRAAMARASAERHRDRFTVDRMVREVAAVYGESVAGGRGRLRAWRR